MSDDKEEVINHLLERFPQKVPVCVMNKLDENNITQKKFMIPRNHTISQFMSVLRTKLSLNSKEAIFIIINNTLAPSHSTINEMYNQHNENKILYVNLIKENTFG